MTDPADAPPARPFIAIALIVAAVMCFGALDTTTKVVAAVAPVAMGMWMRYLFQTVVIGATALPRQRGDLLRTRRLGLHCLRGALLLFCSSIAFYSLRFMPVGEFTAIVMLTPLVMTLVAALSLRESVSWLRWCCVAGGFAGSLLVIRPGREMFHWASLLPLILVCANTGYLVLTSRLAKTEDPRTMHFYGGLAGFALSSLALPFVWQPLPWAIWGALVLLGAISTLGHFLLILAYGRAPVAVLTPYLYLQIAFASLGGWLVFAHLPDTWSLAGIALVSCCGVFGTWLTARETGAQGARSKPRPA